MYIKIVPCVAETSPADFYGASARGNFLFRYGFFSTVSQPIKIRKERDHVSLVSDWLKSDGAGLNRDPS